ncbi:MAG: hypothetical protein AAF532_14290 [Planctomycetota bacterium]
MRTLGVLLIGFASVAAVTGCQCFPRTTDKAADAIDSLGDRPPRADRLYDPRLDLTRIGRPDGKPTYRR